MSVMVTDVFSTGCPWMCGVVVIPGVQEDRVTRLRTKRRPMAASDYSVSVPLLLLHLQTAAKHLRFSDWLVPLIPCRRFWSYLVYIHGTIETFLIFTQETCTINTTVYVVGTNKK